jgi:alginate O-acetyltransferase complex protein AlgJ
LRPIPQASAPATHAASANATGLALGRLAQTGGINIVDTASMIHSLKGTYEFELFPQGGVHWNDVGAALAVSVIVEEINRQAGQEIIPPSRFSYALSGVANTSDRELIDLLNVFLPPLSYRTSKVMFMPSVKCADSPARKLDAAVVGSSFGHLPARMMIEANCLYDLQFYYYATLGRFGGLPYHELQRNLSGADLDRLLDAKVLILEENESFVARMAYVDRLRAIVTRP